MTNSILLLILGGIWLLLSDSAENQGQNFRAGICLLTGFVFTAAGSIGMITVLLK